MADRLLERVISEAIIEDVGEGDHTSLACINPDAAGTARLLAKQEGVLAGMRAAMEVFRQTDSRLGIIRFFNDGDTITQGDVVFEVTGLHQSILRAERLTLNILQRMSGIATQTSKYVKAVEGTRAKILDTRKTSPGLRMLEKEAVRIGGGMNHRMGLYDMVMIKDNHIDFAGSIAAAIDRTRKYLKEKGLSLKVEIEARNIDDVAEILRTGGVDRIMFDNFSADDTLRAVEMVNGRFETESSGGITLETVRSFALCGVDFISVGALTHQISSLDMSLKAY
ncbi:MAG: carboxylating nicotinate-nucleotide diphosphorylase [Bacteroidetes bacterium]|nr:carboxylating nicotinate-nucleotide diphosphorylase [Bacteroidota bacterium]